MFRCAHSCERTKIQKEKYLGDGVSLIDIRIKKGGVFYSFICKSFKYWVNGLKNISRQKENCYDVSKKQLPT